MTCSCSSRVEVFEAARPPRGGPRRTGGSRPLIREVRAQRENRSWIGALSRVTPARYDRRRPVAPWSWTHAGVLSSSFHFVAAPGPSGPRGRLAHPHHLRLAAGGHGNLSSG